MIRFMSLEEQAEHDVLKRKVWSTIKEQKIEGVGLLKGVVKLTKEVMMGDENEVSKPTEAQETLAKMIPLSCPAELPKDFSENCQRIWEAFNVGRDYERLLKEENYVELTLGGKLDGAKCRHCGAENVYFTNYINLGAPNVECRSCKEKWVTSPETKLYINPKEI